MTELLNPDGKIQFMTGLLESIKVLLETTDPELLKLNIKHIKEMIPVAIQQLED